MTLVLRSVEVSQEIDSALDSAVRSYDDARVASRRDGRSDRAARARRRGARSVARARSRHRKTSISRPTTLKSKIAPQETKLYGGSIKNPKELTDLQADVDQLKRHLVDGRRPRTRSDVAARGGDEEQTRAAAAELAAMEAAWREEQAELRRSGRPPLARRWPSIEARAGSPGGRHRAEAAGDVRPDPPGTPRKGHREAGPQPLPGLPDLASDEHRQQGAGRERARAVPELRAHPRTRDDDMRAIGYFRESPRARRRRSRSRTRRSWSSASARATRSPAPSPTAPAATATRPASANSSRSCASATSGFVIVVVPQPRVARQRPARCRAASTSRSKAWARRSRRWPGGGRPDRRS